MAHAILSPLPDVVRHSPAMQKVWNRIERLARFDLPVLLAGETGVGKDVAARAIHLGGPRAGEPFVAINCAAIAPGVAESELFGHVRGAYTGAERTRAGAFARAGRGTLFLDEVAELAPNMQAKLLRVLENGSFVPVGADVEVEHRARIVAATCRDLPALVAEGRFREDLYHRLGVVVVRIPPLRERPEDIDALLDVFAAEAARRLGHPVRITPDARTAARRHRWPGNVRALKNAVLRAAALHEGRIDARALLSEEGSGAATCKAPRDAIPVPRGTYRQMRAHLLRQIVAECGSIRQAASVLDVPRSTLAEWIKRCDGAAPAPADGASDRSFL